ncbi:MAG TPA: hypothetical protein VMA35_06895 [Candidatus Sulfopaludibacter sp.]|nr:hypothetical protein [Candidatus Sulfopaludibacter sp.]
MKTKLHLGKNPLQTGSEPVCGQQVVLENEDFYRIANYDRMPPFFMTVVSDADHWMFVSSNGALSAGRRNADLALFPYYTDDKIRDMAEVTGSKTILITGRRGTDQIWEPFSERGRGIYRIRRNLYKNFRGNKLIFEEINEDLELVFRHGWFNSNRFGFVRRAWLTYSGSGGARIELLDGLQNLMPCGTGSQFNLEYSTLLDAYKRSELIAKTGLGLFRLSAIPVDRPEPAEALRAATVWPIGLKRQVTLLSSTQLDRFRHGRPLRNETDVRGERGAYFIRTTLNLRHGQTADWLLAADVGRGPSEVAELNRLLHAPARLRKLVEADIDRGTRELERIVGAADGLQKTARPLSNARHYGNTLFNVMRGGIFNDGYKLDPDDLLAFIANANRKIAARHAAFLRRLPRPARYGQTVSAAAATGDPQLERLCREYLPLTFSRRHGDPTRPWNRFSIATRNADGTRILNYEGNWRDIFQNWEALAVSFPGFVSGMICRFVNASTADGYNPYRITRNGIDWEIVDPHDPWSHIGYWGDHQIIYLLKLLEILHRHDPATLRRFLTRDIFAYANVPYRIKPHDALRADPKNTVIFDTHAEALVRQRVRAAGADGKLVWDPSGRVRLVNFTEKLLVPVLVKLSNFIPEAGIWLNTQRPEWNDANNALVGNGASMVTLYYLRRYLAFCRELFREDSCLPGQSGERAHERMQKGQAIAEFSLSSEVANFFGALSQTLGRHRPLLAGKLTDHQRHCVLDDLGQAGSEYRRRLYQNGLSGRKSAVTGQELVRFFDTALEWINHSMKANRRSDRLFHAYNLVRFERRNRLSIRRLYEMLEGQVAALSSGLLSAEESLDILAALKRSRMYRTDQHSYLLYPDRLLPAFVERNNIPAGKISHSPLLRKLLADRNRQLIERDVAGRLHFNGSITNARDIHRILDELAATGYSGLVKQDAVFVLDLFERLFDHESFTGRSGTFFGYEGLGCIYWHMVSKLRLAAQETCLRALEAGTPRRLWKRLAEYYYDIRAGIGDYKTPESYGAFPMDPYSHTPAQGGARQPGLTGQVKEDVLCRFGELGVGVREGCIHFEPQLLRREEFLSSPATFSYFDVASRARKLRLKTGALAFTYCQVPVVYQLAPKPFLTIVLADGQRQREEVRSLNQENSRAIFERTGMIKLITAGVPLPI